MSTDSLVNLLNLPADRVFSYRYRQPDGYHFCLDSLIFAHYVISEVRKNAPNAITENFRALDICAGCGVIGFEISHSLPEIRKFDFIEIQNAFRESFDENLAQAEGLAPRDFRFLQMNYNALLEPAYKEQYDLIVSNPPYFFEGEGILSPSELRNRCRFFLDASLRDLICASVNALKPSGTAYLLVKTGSIHGRDAIIDLQKELATTANLQFCVKVRGTSVLRITRTQLPPAE